MLQNKLDSIKSRKNHEREFINEISPSNKKPEKLENNDNLKRIDNENNLNVTKKSKNIEYLDTQERFLQKDVKEDVKKQTETQSSNDDFSKDIIALLDEKINS